jgi:hypothetical protein
MTGYENAKWSNMISTTPGGTPVVAPKSCAIPPGLLQNCKIEKPKATVGTTNGISAKLSRIVIQLPRLLTTSQANGIPQRTSRLETTNPMMNDHDTAAHILPVTAAGIPKLGSEIN